MNTGTECNGDNIPRLYTNVTQFVDFVEWAAKCHFEKTRLYHLGISKVENWAKTQFCRLEERMTKIKEVYSFLYSSLINHVGKYFYIFI